MRKLAGLPLVEYVLRAALKAKTITRLVVSSDDDEVLKLQSRYPAVTFLRRPDELALDESPAIDYVRHVLTATGKAWDVIVILQPTTPFVRGKDIDSTISLLSRNDVDSAVSVMRVEQMHHPMKLKVMDGDLLKPFLRDEGGIIPAQKLPDVYTRNGAVYASKLNSIEQGQIIGERCAGFVMPPERSIDINYPIDFEFAEFIASRYPTEFLDAETD